MQLVTCSHSKQPKNVIAKKWLRLYQSGSETRSMRRGFKTIKCMRMIRPKDEPRAKRTIYKTLKR